MYKIFDVFGYPNARTPGRPRALGRPDARTPGRPGVRTPGRADARASGSTPGRSDACPPLFQFLRPPRRGPEPGRADSSRAAPSRAGRRRLEPGGAGPPRGGRKNCEKRTKNERKTRFWLHIFSDPALHKVCCHGDAWEAWQPLLRTVSERKKNECGAEYFSH